MDVHGAVVVVGGLGGVVALGGETEVVGVVVAAALVAADILPSS